MIVRQRPQSSPQSSAIRAPLMPASSSVTSCSTKSATASRTSFSFSSMIWSFVSTSSASGTVSACAVEPPLERDLVAHAERADEHVHLAAVRVVEEEEPLLRVHRVERRCAGRSRARGAAAAASPERLLRRREVEVLVLALRARAAGRPSAAGPRHRRGGGAGTFSRARRVEDAAAFRDDVGEDLRRVRQCVPRRRCRR